MSSNKTGVVLNCRTCTRACKQYKSLQEEFEIGPEGSTTLASMLNYCCSLSFEPQDGALMPQHICINCLQMLEQAFNFKRMVIDSDELLRLGLEDVEPVATDSPTVNQEFVMIELLNEKVGLKAENGIDNITALAETYNEPEPEPEPETLVTDVDDLVFEETELDTETEDALEVLNGYQPADIEYVTIKSEYSTQAQEEDDDIEVMDAPHLEAISDQMQIQMIDDQMVIMSGDEVLDDVSGDMEGDELLVMEPEEHLEGEDYLDNGSLDDSVSTQQTSTGTEVLPHVCHICKKAFRQQCRLNQHMRSHVDIKLYGCEVCGKKLKHLRNYKEHMLTHTNEKPHQCNICTRFYRTTSSLAAHMRTHAEDKPHKCDQCGRSYAAFDHLRRHKLTHTGERPYACDLCDKAYYDSSSLRQHKISHTGEKAFTCEICGVGLSQKSGYKKHMLVHSGEKPHKCHICGRAFTFTSNLNAHVRLHSGEKPFKCDKCMKAFPTKKRLNSHLRVHNKEAPVTSTTTSSISSSSSMERLTATRRVGLRLPDVNDHQVSTSRVVVVL
ncbi:dwg [Drosophila busckii]|uniref:Dwg n=1 Tax=Drosophila busckii TaxID=30019 RepID=A0A0M4EMG4_DROBS|nr:dwg [Drosophila busckii]